MIICGISYSLKMIAKCAINFFKYPASIKPNLNSKDVVRFPKVTICLNGMHSTKKIEQRYPGYGPVIRELYTGSFNDRPISRNRTVNQMLDSVIYDDFINATSNEFIIFGCRYMNTGCLKNWTMEFTRFGRCAVFNPDIDQIGEKTAVGRKASLSIVVGYNQSDANVGWYSFLSGVTMYYSSPSESFLDPLNSLSLPPETVPMLSVVQIHRKLLGPPYSTCVQNHSNFLSYFPVYTEDRCLHECLADVVIGVCDCIPQYLLPTRPVKKCTLLRHSVCISKVKPVSLQSRHVNRMRLSC